MTARGFGFGRTAHKGSKGLFLRDGRFAFQESLMRIRQRLNSRPQLFPDVCETSHLRS